MSDVSCSCGFPLESLDAVHRVEPSQGKPTSEVALSCPLCGTPIVVKLQTVGVLARERSGAIEFLRWKRPGATVGNTVALGLFRLEFDNLGLIEPREVCHAAALAFRGEDGELRVPVLPVRREYFDCIDQSKLAALRERGQLGRLVGGEYIARLPLRGFEGEAVEIRIPLATIKSPGAEDNAVLDVNVRLWPNLPTESWHHFLVGLSAVGPRATAVLGESRRLRLWSRGETVGFSRAASVQRGGESLVGSLAERPTWLSLELTRDGQADDPVADALAGGLMQVPAATARATADTIQMGLDFGTSNTCVAFSAQGQEKADLVPRVDETIWSLYLVRAGAEPSVHKGPDLWPSSVGFGRYQDLFPSEFLFLRKVDDQAGQLGSIEDWSFGLDFGIPAAGVRPAFSEAEYVLGEFKWAEMIRGTAFQSKIEWLQAQYIAGVLLCAYARWAVVHGKTPGTVRVKYAYPMAFEQGDLDTLRNAGDHAAKLLARWTGLQWSLDIRMNESEAAAQGGDPRNRIQVFVDMGGGSTDIAVNVRDFDILSTPYITSVRYAGAALLAAYEGSEPRTSCLAAGATGENLRRAIREAAQPADVIADPKLFDSDKERVRANRTQHFYGYVVELVARMIAAGVIERHFAGQDDNGGRREYNEDIGVSLFFLGNGWRLNATITASNFKQDLHARVKERVMALVKDVLVNGGTYGAALKDALKGRKLLIELKDHSFLHDKAAVAIGLLSSDQSSSAAVQGSRPAGILGWPTIESSRKGRRTIPWFARYDVRDGKNPTDLASDSMDLAGDALGFDDEPAIDPNGPSAWYQKLAKPFALDFEDGAPKIAEGLRTIKELDPKLEKSLGVLRAKCATPNDTWLRRGPLEVLLEELFKKKLREIGA